MQQDQKQRQQLPQQQDYDDNSGDDEDDVGDDDDDGDYDDGVYEWALLSCHLVTKSYYHRCLKRDLTVLVAECPEATMITPTMMITVRDDDYYSDDDVACSRFVSFFVCFFWPDICGRSFLILKRF